MRKYLPSKKVIWLFIVVVFVLAIILTLPDPTSTAVNPKESKNLITKDQLRPIADKDSDRDGLADWEESLWQSDPLNPDSDGDGTTDGEEVTLNRDPTTPAPDDFLGPVTEKVLSQEENLTLTEKFGRDLFTGYTQLTTNPVFRGDKTEVLYNFLSGNFENAPKPREYFLSELNIKTQNTNSGFKEYGNNLVSNLKRGVGLNELEVIIEIFDSEGERGVEELREIARVNSEILNENITLAVPNNIARLHLALINSHNQVIDSILKITNLKTDPLVAILGIGQYSRSTKLFEESFNNLKRYYLREKIFFSTNDPGNILTK